MPRVPRSRRRTRGAHVGGKGTERHDEGARQRERGLDRERRARVATPTEHARERCARLQRDRRRTQVKRDIDSRNAREEGGARDRRVRAQARRAAEHAAKQTLI